MSFVGISFVRRRLNTLRSHCIELWNEEYRDGIKTRGDKIGMDLWIIKPLNDVRRKFSANHYAYW